MSWGGQISFVPRRGVSKHLADRAGCEVVLLAVQLNGAWWRLLVSCGLLVVAGLCKETGFTFFGLLAVSASRRSAAGAVRT